MCREISASSRIWITSLLIALTLVAGGQPPCLLPLMPDLALASAAAWSADKMRLDGALLALLYAGAAMLIVCTGCLDPLESSEIKVAPCTGGLIAAVPLAAAFATWRLRTRANVAPIAITMVGAGVGIQRPLLRSSDQYDTIPTARRVAAHRWQVVRW